MDDELRKIPLKNYLILGVIILVTILIIYYFYAWYDAYKETKLNMRILDKYMEVINYNELDNYLIENPNTVLYVSVLENEKIREFEKEFKKSLKNHEINQTVLYMDITNDVKDSKIKDELLVKYGISYNNLPVILVLNNGSLTRNMSISDNNYDIKIIEEFINSVGNQDDLNG